MRTPASPGWDWSRSTGRRCTATRRITQTRVRSRSPKEILAEADAIDAQQDEQFGDRHGDAPLELQTGRGLQGVAARGPQAPGGAARRRTQVNPGITTRALEGVQAPA